MDLREKIYDSIGIVMELEKSEKNQQVFICEKCDFITSHKYNWNRHISTDKHFMICFISFLAQERATLNTSQNTFICYCGKTLIHQPNLYRHQKTCKFIKKIKEQSEITTNKKNADNVNQENKNQQQLISIKDDISSNMVLIDKEKLALMEENSRLKDQLITHLQSVKNVIIGNNNTINAPTFNIILHLENNYPNAMNLTDFVDNIKCDVNDLKYTKNKGFISGLSNIFIKNLELLDPDERPIHCSDKRGNHIYIRDDNKWEKNDKGKLEVQLDYLTKKQLSALKDWEEEHQNWHESETLMDEYIKLVKQLTSPNDEESERRKEKIKRNIGKSVILNEIVEKRNIKFKTQTDI